MNTNEPVSYACQIVEADFEANILKIEMLDEDYSVSAGIKFLSNTHPVKEDAQYDKGFDDGCKHTKKIYEAEIEALKESINEALASIPAYGEQGFYFEHHDINGEYLGHSSIHAEDVVQRIEAILRKASEK